MAQLPGYCTGVATDIHHLYSGADRAGHYLDTDEWISICRGCHGAVHDKFSTEELIEMGLRKINS